MQPKTKKHNETPKEQVPNLIEYIFERLGEDKLVIAKDKEEAVIKVLTRELEIDPKILGVRLVKGNSNYVLVLKKSEVMRINVRQKVNDKSERKRREKLFIISFHPLEKSLLARNHRISSAL